MRGYSSPLEGAINDDGEERGSHVLRVPVSLLATLMFSYSLPPLPTICPPLGFLYSSSLPSATPFPSKYAYSTSPNPLVGNTYNHFNSPSPRFQIPWVEPPAMKTAEPAYVVLGGGDRG
jgi:hypothetical protein